MADMRLSNNAVRIVSSPWTICTLTIVVRFVVFLQLLPVQGTHGFYKYDEQARIGWAMSVGYGFSSPWMDTPLLPTAQQPPLYPWLLAGIFKLTGVYSHTSLLLIEIFNVVCAMLTALLILKVGRQVFGASAGVLAALIWACWLDEAVVCLRVWESSVSALLLILSVWIVLQLKQRPASGLWPVFGVLAGVAALTNTSLLAVFTGYWLWMLFTERTSYGRSRILLSIFTSCLVVLPWTLRNYEAFHRIVPVRDNFGFELWQGNHMGTSDVIAEFNQLGEIGFMEAKRSAAINFIAEDPARFLHGCAVRFFRFWSSPSVWMWLPISILSWIGCLTAIREKPSTAVPLVIPILLFPLVYYVTHPGTYRHPIEPVMFLLAVHALMTIARRMRN